MYTMTYSSLLEDVRRYLERGFTAESDQIVYEHDQPLVSLPRLTYLTLTLPAGHHEFRYFKGGWGKRGLAILDARSRGPLRVGVVGLAFLAGFGGLAIPVFGFVFLAALAVLFFMRNLRSTIIGDTLARTLFAPQQLPVGVITAFIGVPFFLFLLNRMAGKQS